MTSRRAAIAAWAVCLAMAVPAVVLLAIGPGRVLPSDIFAGVGGLAFLVLGLTFASVGALVAWRAPRNPIGWIFALTGLVNTAQLLSWQYADVGLHRTHLPGAAAANVFNSVIGEATAGMLFLSLLVFPDGRLPSRRWRPALACVLVGIGLLVAAGTLRPGPYAQPFASRSNPLGVAGARSLMNAVDAAGWLFVVAGAVAAIAAMVARLRRAHGIERQQLKLVLAVGALVGGVTAALMTTWLVWPNGHLQLRMAGVGVAFAAFPAAAGVAILRYRLYDIDVVINRAIVYGLATALLAATYVGLVLLLQVALRAVTGGSGLAVALSTLAVAALFSPARARIQRLVDRRFYRSKYDAERTLSAFAARLRDEIDLEALRSELTSVVGDTMQPEHVSLWLRSAR